MMGGVPQVCQNTYLTSNLACKSNRSQCILASAGGKGGGWQESIKKGYFISVGVQCLLSS